MKKLLLTALSVLAISTASATVIDTPTGPKELNIWGIDFTPKQDVSIPVPENTYPYVEAVVGPFPFPMVGIGLGVRHKFNKDYALDASVSARTMAVVSAIEAKIHVIKYLNKNKINNRYFGVGLSCDKAYSSCNGEAFAVTGFGPHFVFGKETVSSDNKLSFMQVEANIFQKVNGAGFDHVSLIPGVSFRVGKSF